MNSAGSEGQSAMSQRGLECSPTQTQTGEVARILCTYSTSSTLTAGQFSTVLDFSTGTCTVLLIVRTLNSVLASYTVQYMYQ